LTSLSGSSNQPAERAFNGERAYEDVVRQVEFGPRIPGTPGHEATIAWMVAVLEEAGWEVDIQQGTQMGHPIQNVIAKRGVGERPWVILGAHYDTRMRSDQDPEIDQQMTPVPGANDGASGVAVLTELARTLPGGLENEVWLVFFDAEDNGSLPGWDWILGSRYFVQNLEGNPDAAVIVDMVGDADLNIHYERNSDPEISMEIWEHAAALGYSQFIPTPKYAMLDDHTPFYQAGIPAVDIIDFDYPYWHTTEDTVDKVSAGSLEAVGETLLAWLLSEGSALD
jgi:Zn-dependent M28 family amino/carboxypeptidase